ncbi:radical SAM protein [Deferrisoma sp.]
MTPTVPLTLWAQETADEFWEHRVPVEGTFELTRACPFSCPHCYCPEATPGAELTTPQILGLLDELAEAGCLWLTLTGGEPLAHPGFERIYLHAVERGFLVTLFTNGFLLDRRVREVLAYRAPASIEISVYGVSEHGYGRATGRPDAWPAVRAHVEAAVAEGLPVTLKTVLTRATAPELDAMATWARDLGVGFRFDPAINPRLDGAAQPLGERLSPEEVLAVEARFSDRSEAWREACALPSGGAGPNGLGCGAGRTAFHLTAEGAVTPCLLLPGVGVSALEGGFRAAWERDIPRMLDLLPPGNPECGACDLGNLCDHCPAWAFLEHGRWNARVEYLCSLAHGRAEAFGRKCA